MATEVEAVYEGGVLKLTCPLELAEGTKVMVIVGQARRVRQSYGLIKWKGSPEELERLALDPEFGIHERP